MIPKERIFAAINHEVPDRIPLAVLEIEEEYKFARFLGIEDPQEQVHPDIGYYSPAYEKLGIDCFRLEMAYEKQAGQAPNGEVLNEWGACAKKDYGTGHWYPLADVDRVSQVENHPWPDPDGFDYGHAAGKAQRIADCFAVRGPHWWPLLCRVFDLVGMEKALMQMALEPRVFEAILDRVFELTYASTEKLIHACGDDMHIVCAGDDFASQQGMILAPDAWRTYLKPRYAKLFDLAKQHGKYVWFHSCGNILDVLPDLIDIGMDVWETVQLHTLPIPPEQLKREYGKHITFFGAVNSQRLPFMTPAQVGAETVRCIDALAAGGGYICSADHGIRSDVPYENITALFDAARNYRKRNCTLAV